VTIYDHHIFQTIVTGYDKKLNLKKKVQKTNFMTRLVTKATSENVQFERTYLRQNKIMQPGFLRGSLRYFICC